MLPKEITQEYRDKYNLSGVFSSSPPHFIDRWYEMQRVLQPLKLDSFLQVGIGPNLEMHQWNSLLIDLFDASYFLNIDVDQEIINKAKASGKHLLANCELCDVREVDKLLDDNAIDAVFWSHGPEHIKREEWKDTFEKLEKVAKKVVILQCPWGDAYNGDVGHVSPSIEEDEFKEYGYTVLVMGNKNTRHANILAYKVL